MLYCYIKYVLLGFSNNMKIHNFTKNIKTQDSIIIKYIKHIKALFDLQTFKMLDFNDFLNEVTDWFSLQFVGELFHNLLPLNTILLSTSFILYTGYRSSSCCLYLDLFGVKYLMRLCIYIFHVLGFENALLSALIEMSNSFCTEPWPWEIDE